MKTQLSLPRRCYCAFVFRVKANVIKLSSPDTRQFWEIEVLYEDEHLLAINKPERLLGSPDRCDPERPNLMKLLHRDIERGASWAKARGLTYLMNAHRLDFETSGVMLLAKSKPVLAALADLFGSEKPVKTYVALSHGTPLKSSFSVNAKLAPHPAQPGIIRVDEKHGKNAKTLFEVRERFDRCTLLQCRPLTGRTHQIRVHLKKAGFPIVGDVTYGGHELLLSSLKSDYRLKPNKVERPLIASTALHAEQLEITHPISGSTVSISAPWPKDLTVAVKYLRRYRASSGNNPV
jgi:23S rRNA pseudouridine1911/1915/1917 synthase